MLIEAQQTLSKVSETAKLDAQVLLSFVLGKEISYLFTWPEKLITDSQYQQFNTLLARRLTGEPIAYLVGSKEFWSLDLYVAPSTLIPRPDTETLVELVLNNHSSTRLSCLDLGTGTGAIALALASEQKNWQIDAVDYNESAVKLAQLNAKNNQLTQVNIYQSNWFEEIKEPCSFDVIVSNPPYIDKNDQHLSQGDVRFEPLSALVADENGYADLEHIIERSRRYLTTQGYLYLEHGFEQALQVRAMLTQYGYDNVVTAQDLAGNDRITYGCYQG